MFTAMFQTALNWSPIGKRRTNESGWFGIERAGNLPLAHDNRSVSTAWIGNRMQSKQKERKKSSTKLFQERYFYKWMINIWFQLMVDNICIKMLHCLSPHSVFSKAEVSADQTLHPGLAGQKRDAPRLLVFIHSHLRPITNSNGEIKWKGENVLPLKWRNNGKYRAGQCGENLLSCRAFHILMTSYHRRECFLRIQ